MIRCRLFGHDWGIRPGFELGDPIACARCGRDMGYMEQARRTYPDVFTPASEPHSVNVARLDPKPWVFVSDQVFGVRSAIDKGFHSVSGAYYVFQPRLEYEQDRAHYGSVDSVSDPRRRNGE